MASLPGAVMKKSSGYGSVLSLARAISVSARAGASGSLGCGSGQPYNQRALAAQMGRPSMSSQAVGGAVGHNPISIIIPCHRVVGSGGSLTGYAGGIAAKLRLLEHEGVELSRLSVPKRGTAL